MKSNIIITCLLLAITLTTKAQVTILHNIEGNTINNSKQVMFSAMAFDEGKVIEIGTKERLLQSYPSAILIKLI